MTYEKLEQFIYLKHTWRHPFSFLTYSTPYLAYNGFGIPFVAAIYQAYDGLDQGEYMGL